MKTIRFILMLSIIGMTACHNIEEQVLTQNQKQKIQRRSLTSTCDLECMQEYAAANTDIFGEQVFIFNTLDEAYDYLESLADSELNEKTAMYEASGVNCPIINSLIYWETGEELCGINNTEPNNITTTQIEEFEQYLSLQPDMYQVMFI